MVKTIATEARNLRMEIPLKLSQGIASKVEKGPQVETDATESIFFVLGSEVPRKENLCC